MTLPVNEFIRRFLLHILPDGFMRIRHFGFLANRSKKQNLSRCRQLLGLNPELPQASDKTIRQQLLELTGIDWFQCPRCKQGTMIVIAQLPNVASSPFPTRPMPHRLDSS